MQDQGSGVPPQPEGAGTPPVPPPQPAATPPPPAPGMAPAGPPMMMPQGMGGGLMKWDGTPLPPDFAEKKMLAGILGILLGSFGVHKFVLGYNTAGVIMLVVSLVSIPLWFIFIGIFGTMAMGIIGLVEGIMYLTKSDQDFVMTYGVNKKEWF